MRKIKIKPELLSLLTSGEFKHFRSQELIDAYQNLPSSSKLNQRQVQQFIFRNLDRLVWAGLAIREDKGTNKHGEYRLTSRFTSENYDVGTPHCKEVTHQSIVPVESNNDHLLQLKEQLSTHKLELLTTIAETEEYEALCQQLPSKQPEIQELYNDARNRYSKTLGKVKAIEALISRTGNTN
jgi:hypothetical protein